MDRNTLIKDGVYSEFLKYKSYLHKNGCDSYDPKNYKDLLNEEEASLCIKIKKADIQKKRRGLHELIQWSYVIQNTEKFKDYQMIFGTLTFKDSVLADTSKETRRRYVSRFLKEQTYEYIANIDFGKKNNREHYHFIAICEDKINPRKWTYGSKKFEEIRMNSSNMKRVKNYLMKLNNHTYKDSTKRERIIASRNIDNSIENICKYSRDFNHYKRTIIYGEL